ncbi:hypothetical protein C0J52_10680, partial [Blattella germanica]
SGGANCIRCFHILLRSRNVLQVRTEGLDKCYTNQDAAEATCPDEKAIQQGDISKAIVFYKTKDLGGEEIKQVYCPINGRFNFVYSIIDGSDNRMECPDPVSELDNCPSGSDLNLRFRNCRFQNRDVTFQCLGHWAGPGDQHYLALRDTSSMSEHRLPPYRCALYREEAGTGNVFMAFSNSLHGLMVIGSTCILRTYTIRCLGPETATSDRFAVFARTQCGEEMYNCIWLKRRGVNVLEFQLVAGEYAGVIPDAANLCARLSSDCRSPEIMYYTVSDCSGSEVYEAWTTESSHRTNSGWAGQDDSSNWNARYGPSGRGSKPNREWNSQSPSHSTYPGPGSDWQMNQRTGPNKDQNEYWEVTQRTPEYYPSGSRSQGYPNEYPQGSQRYPTSNTNQYPQGIPRNSDKYLGSGIQNDHNHRTENFPDSNRNQGLPHSGYAQGSQNLPENYSGDTRNQDFPQSTQKTIQTYSGTNGNQEAPHNEIPHSTQRTYENHFGSNTRNQGFPPKEYPTATQRIPEHFGGGNRNYESQQGNQRFPDNYSGTNRNQGFRQTEHPQTTRTYENFPGKSGNQGYPSSDQSQPTQRSFENFPGPHTNKNIPQNSQPTQRSSGNNYHANNRNQVFQKEYPQRGYENYPSGNRNIGFPQRENSDQTQRNYAYPDGKQRYPQNDYSGARDVTRGDISPKPGPDSTVSTSAIGIRDRNRGATDPNEREYRCLGQWKEDGLMYTYTQRRDVGTYECFVGSIVSDNEIYIKEAGDHCQRDIDPMHNGMKLKRKGLCFGNHPGDGGNTGAGMPQPRPTTSWMSSRRPPEPTKPWKPITAPPKDSGGAESSKRFSPILFLVACSIVFFLQQ